MQWEQFKTRAPGKWVLAGEHSVLRGGTAVAIPQREICLALSFVPAGGYSVDAVVGTVDPVRTPKDSSSKSGILSGTSSASGQDASLSVWPLEAQPLIHDLINSIGDEWESQGRAFPKPRGNLRIESTIPIGAGLGSSAALCVALTRWLSRSLAITESGLIEFATQLEHRFHGRSSGMDVAVIASDEPVSFAMGRGPLAMGVKKLPKFSFHDTGLRSRTSDCVLRVESFQEKNPVLAMEVDEAMGAASRMAMEGLVLFDSGRTAEGLKILRRSIQQARECFYAWELVPGEAKRLEEKLLSEGALAVKLTGAGGGGMLVALWE